MNGLLSVQVLSVLDVEAEEVTQFSRCVYLCLPCVLALSKHCRGHDLVAVFSTDQVGGFEEDCGAVVEGEGFPCWFGGKGGVDGGGDVGGVCVCVFDDCLLVV